MFTYELASDFSLAKRKAIYGVAINDSKYQVIKRINGKVTTCPYYGKWQSMIERCYSELKLKKSPAYVGCTVCDEWLLFSNFKKWMVKQDWENKHIDKDILISGNKIYSPETCIFVSPRINGLFRGCKIGKVKYPTGVTPQKLSGKFRARCAYNEKVFNLGHFNTVEAAFEVYKSFKYMIIAMFAEYQTEPLKSAMLNYKIKGVCNG